MHPGLQRQDAVPVLQQNHRLFRRLPGQNPMLRRLQDGFASRGVDVGILEQAHPDLGDQNATRSPVHDRFVQTPLTDGRDQVVEGAGA
ncbi:hypothetical protein D3C81_1409720 [compost metagenome]